MLKAILSFLFESIGKSILIKEYRYLIILGIRLLLKPDNGKIKIHGNKIWYNDRKSLFYQYYEIYCKKYYDLPIQFDSSYRILDCGANIGLSALRIHHNQPELKIICYEPDRTVFEKLQYNTSKVPKENIQLINAGVYINNGKVQFVADGKDGGRVSDEVSNNTEEIEVVDLKEIMKESSPIALIKMDIEGAEHEVLPYIKSEITKVQYFFLEFHQLKGTKNNLANLMQPFENAGFNYVIDIPKNYHNPFNYKGLNDMFESQINVFFGRF